MKHKLHMHAIDGGAFKSRPADCIELEGERILANDVRMPWDTGSSDVRLWVVGNEYGAIAAAWADCEQDALDELTNAGLLDSFLVSEEDQASAPAEEAEEWAHLGNAGEPADLTNAWIRAVGLTERRDCRLLCAFAAAEAAGEPNLG